MSLGTIVFCIAKQENIKEHMADMTILRKSLRWYDDVAGESTFVHLIREKVHALIFYAKDLIFVVSCEKNTNRGEIADISEEIENILKKYLSYTLIFNNKIILSCIFLKENKQS